MVLAAAGQVATQEAVETKCQSTEDGWYTAEGRVALPDGVDAGDAFGTLLDYESSSEIFHNITEAIVASDPKTGQKQLEEKCKWTFLVFSGTFDMLLDVDEDVPNRTLVFSLAKPGVFMKAFEGRWEVRETEVRHTLTVRPGITPPPALSNYTEKVFERQVRRVMEDLLNAW